MATLEKLQKALETLKIIIKSSQLSETRKKEKIQLCHTITEALSNPTIKVSSSFNIILGVTIETFLELCNDPESDVRMISDECLNRVIRSASDTHMSKIQIELHKEIKKNGAPRCLRAALFRFSQLAHHIRTHKGKAYVTNLFPSIIKICERDEELIHETLANSFPRIIEVLGCFAPESETKVLLKAFLKNITKPSTVIRRTSSNCVLNICLNSKRPYAYICYCIDNLLDFLIPLDENLNEATILGVLGCLKILLPCLNHDDFSKNNVGYTKDLEIQTFPVYKLLQIYELCLLFLKNKNHNVVIASFETLNVLLTNANDELRKFLLNSNGLEKSRVTRSSFLNSIIRSPSQLSVSTNITTNEDSLFSECELTETVETDIERWINESKLTMLSSPLTVISTKSFSADTLTDISDKNVEMTDFSVPQNLLDAKKSDSGDNLDRLSDSSSGKSCSVAMGDTEGIQEVDIGEFLDKSVSLLYCTRLIVKSFLLYGVSNKSISDRIVRVSVKSSAINCLTSIFKIYPAGFYKCLDKNYVEDEKEPLENKVSNQKVADLLLFAEHSDPQIRGAISSLVAELLVAIFKDNLGDFSSSEDCYDSLLKTLEKGLTDENSNCLRQTLTSLNPLLNKLAESRYCERISVFLEKLPLLASNPYWLVKVSLCELVSKLCYTKIFHITGNVNFQNQIIYNVLIECLRDIDQRIRTAAASALVEIMSRLYSPEFQPKQSVVTAAAKEMCEKHLKCLEDKELGHNINKQHFVRSMPFPYSEITKKSCEKTEFNLSEFVSKLYIYVLKSSSKYFIAGCIETLSLLSTHFPPTVYKKAWSTIRKLDSDMSTNDISDILTLCVTLLTSSSLVFDVQFQIHVLTLTGNVYAGFCYSNLLPIRESENHNLWNMFSNQPLRSLSESLLSFIMKLLHVYHVVLNDIIPTPPQSKIPLPHLPSSTNTLSPVKKIRKNVERKPTILGKPLEKQEKMESGKSVDISCFVTSQHYMKIYEVLKSSFINYKISLDKRVSESFVELMKTLLHSLSVILEVASLIEFGRISEEILLYLKSTFSLDCVTTVQCVQQLLKCLFGTNLSCNLLDIIEENEFQSNMSVNASLYHAIFETSFGKLSTAVNLLNNDSSKPEFQKDELSMGFLRRKDIKKPSVIARITSDKALASYIRIFEPIVIKSLKHYTMTGNVRFQSQVLELLSQLVQLRVNYCLLDSDQVFKDFVLKQFEFLEEGQIRHSEELLPKIFQFLVHLSYSKQHSKSIIEIPKIIQLCDGLMASGQSPETHCIPGLEAIIEDVFLVKNKSNTPDLKELETTRDVVFSSLLRLFECKDVVNLVALILEDCKLGTENSEKWLRFSGQAFATFLSSLKQNKIKIEETDAFVSLKKFVSSLHPDVLSTVDEVIVMLFQSPPSMDDSTSFKRWLSKVNILLLILLPLKEETLLSNINKLKADFSPGSVFENFTPSADPLNVHNNADIFGSIPAENIVIRMIFKVISLVTLNMVEVEKRCSDQFLVSQCFLFLVCCCHMFQSGCYSKIFNAMISLLKNQIELNELNLEEINIRFSKLSRFYPNLSLHWWYILTLLNYEDLRFWEGILSEPNVQKNLNNGIVLQGGTVALCDILSDTAMEENTFTFWMLNNCSQSIVNLINEPPVCQFVNFIFRNPDYSRGFLKSFQKFCFSSNNSSFTKKVLKTLDLCDVSQTGTAVKYLTSTSILDQRQIAVARSASTLATRKLELLLTLDTDEVRTQLPEDEILRIKHCLSSRNLDKKNETLVSFLNKLLVQFYDYSPSDFENRTTFSPKSIQHLQIDQAWYFSQMESKACDLKEVAIVLSRLSYNEILKILSSDDHFGRSLISNCLEVGIELTKNIREECAILKAAIEVLLIEIEGVIRQERSDRESNERKLFVNLEFYIQSTHLVASLTSLMCCLKEIKSLNISEREFTNIFQLTSILLEYLVHNIRTDFNINKLENYLNCLVEVLNQPEFFSIFATDDSIYWLCLIVNSVHSLIEYLLTDSEPLPSVDTYTLKTAIENDLTRRAGLTCHKLYILVHWLYRIEILNDNNPNIPNFLFSKIRKIVIVLGRIPQFFSFNLVPLKVWKTGWEPEMSGKFLTEVPALPMDYLQETDVLEEFIFRVNLFGWTSRQQFEETWMSYLSVLCYPLDTIDSIDLSNSIKASSHAVKAITALLMQTLRTPILGNKSMSNLTHVTRNKSICCEAISVKKLQTIQNSIEKHLASKQTSNVNAKNAFQQVNFEKFSDDYSYGQLSIKYFVVATNSHIWDGCAACETYKTRRKLLEDSGIDVTSCLQFLLDYYTQLIKAESSVTDLGLLHEIVKSIIFISDLFTDKMQFEWMQNTVLDLIKVHTYEDELLHQYLIIGLCKSVAVLCPELEVFEQTKKILVQFLKSPFLPSRIACLYGILYLLEGCLLNNTKIGGVSEETQLLLPSIVEYLQLNLNTTNWVLKRSQEHRLLVWSLAFFLIENIDEIHMETLFVDTTLLSAFEVLTNKTGDHVSKCIFKGLERLLIVKSKYISEKIGKQLYSLALENLRSDSSTAFLMGFQLLLTYMYTDCAKQLEEDFPKTQSNPDQLVQTIEKTSAIFEAVKKGHTLEAEVICAVLPTVLNDFFSPSDILTKVIGEFLSSQQPYPKLMSGVVFKVFESAITQNQLSLLQDWVVFSLSNFTQSFSNMVVWSLTCFFISASTNQWLRSTFSYVQTRIGRYDQEDRHMFCVAGTDFYRNLNEAQKKTFVESFTKAKEYPDTPFSDLFCSL